MTKFSSNTIKQIKYYVYLFTWTEHDKERIIYIGKGKGNRVYGSKKAKEKRIQ